MTHLGFTIALILCPGQALLPRDIYDVTPLDRCATASPRVWTPLPRDVSGPPYTTFLPQPLATPFGTRRVTQHPFFGHVIRYTLIPKAPLPLRQSTWKRGFLAGTLRTNQMARMKARFFALVSRIPLLMKLRSHHQNLRKLNDLNVFLRSTNLLKAK